MVAISMLYVTTSLLSVHVPYTMYLAMFLFYFGIYTINRQTDISEDLVNHPTRAQFSGRDSWVAILVGLLAYLAGLALMALHGLYIILLSLIPLIVVLLYGVKFMPKSFNRRRLKEITVIKNLVVALAWATPITFVPLLYSHASINTAAWSVWIILSTMVFINTVVFDMRDVYGDQKERIKTIPVAIGVRRTRRLLVILNIWLTVFIFVSAYTGSLPILGFMIILNTIYTFSYLHLFDRMDRNFVCDVLVDGEYLIMAFFVFVGSFVLSH